MCKNRKNYKNIVLNVTQPQTPFQMMFAGAPAQPPPAESGLTGAADKLAFGLGNLGTYTAAGLGSALSNAVGSVASLVSGLLGRGNYNTYTPSSVPVLLVFFIVLCRKFRNIPKCEKIIELKKIIYVFASLS